MTFAEEHAIEAGLFSQLRPFEEFIDTPVGVLTTWRCAGIRRQTELYHRSPPGGGSGVNSFEPCA
jgi:hypothetical protein